MLTYLFYDIETSGLNKCFDQIIQFAAIRTTLDLIELERHEIWIKLNPDIIPFPEAILINNFSITELLKGICEYEAICKIYELFNVPETITIGYNNLRFDDKFIRFSFYRNLLNPYNHQFLNNCRRMDIYPILVMYRLYNPSIIKWPNDDINFNLRLETLSKCNNLLLKKSYHNALTDVEATIALTKKLQQNSKIWDYLCNFFIKKHELNNLKFLEKNTIHYFQKLGLLIDGSFGKNNYYQVPVIFLGWHKYYSNQSLWFPLDTINLCERDIAYVTENVFIYRKRFGEPPFFLQYKKFFIKHLSNQRLCTIVSNIEWLKNNKSYFYKLIDYYTNLKYPFIENVDIDAALYNQNFIFNKYKTKCEQFHKMNVELKIRYLDIINDHDLKLQMIRLLGRNYSKLLEKRSDYFSIFTNYLISFKNGMRIVDYKNQYKLNPINALTLINNIRQTHNLNINQIKLLSSLTKYIQYL